MTQSHLRSPLATLLIRSPFYLLPSSMREGSKIKRKKTLERVNLNIQRKNRNLCLNCLGRTSKVHYEEEERISVRYLINRDPQFYVLSNQDLYLQFLLYKSLVRWPLLLAFCDDQTYCMCNCV